MTAAEGRANPAQAAAPAGTRAPLARLAVRGTVWTGVSHWLLAVLGLAKTIILARVVRREYFGLLAGAAVWASYLGFTRLDLRPTVLASDEDPDALSAQFILENLAALAGLLVAAVVASLGAGLAPPAVWPLVFALLALAQFEALTSTPAYLTEKRLRYDVLAHLRMAAAIVGFPVSVGLALGGAPIAALLADAILPTVVVRLGVLGFVRWRPRLVWNAARLTAELRRGWTLWTTALLGKVAYELDDWLVFSLHRPHPVVWRGAGVEPEALYARAYGLGKLPLDLVAGSIGVTGLALYAEAAARGTETLAAVRRRLTWLLAWMTFPAGTLGFVLADELVLVLGDQWVPTVPLFRLLILFILGRPLLQNNAQLLLAMDHARDFRRAMLVQALFMLAACPVAVFIFGAAGAAGVASLMSPLGVVLTERRVARLLGASPWRPYLVPAGAAFAAGLLVTLLDPLLGPGVWLAATGKATVCALVFALALGLFDRPAAGEAWRTVRESLRPA